MENRRIEISGMNLSVKEWSPSGRALASIIGIHGFGTNAEWTFKELAPILARKGVKTIGLDLPGFGFSDHAQGYSLKLYSRLIRELASDYTDGLVIALGHSFGAKAVLASLVDSQNLFSGYVLVNPAGFSGVPERLLRLADWSLVRRLLETRIVFDLLRHTPFGDFATLRSFQNPARELAGSYSDLDLDFSGYRQRLETLTLNGLLIWGDSDPILNTSVLSRVKRTLPVIKESIIADGGHLPMKSRPVKVANEVIKFVQQCISAES